MFLYPHVLEHPEVLQCLLDRQRPAPVKTLLLETERARFAIPMLCQGCCGCLLRVETLPHHFLSGLVARRVSCLGHPAFLLCMKEHSLVQPGHIPFLSTSVYQQTFQGAFQAPGQQFCTLSLDLMTSNICLPRFMSWWICFLCPPMSMHRPPEDSFVFSWFWLPVLILQHLLLCLVHLLLHNVIDELLLLPKSLHQQRGPFLVPWHKCLSNLVGPPAAMAWT